MSNRRTLRKAVSDVLKQTSSSDPKKRNDESNQEHSGSEHSVEETPSISFNRGK